MSDPDKTVEPLVDVWNSVLDELRAIAPAMLEGLPPETRDDLQIQHEAGRLLLGALASATLGAIGGDGDHPVFLPSLNEVLCAYQPNADTLYKRAEITPGGSYRLRGKPGSLRIARIGALGSPTAGAGQIHASAYFDINTLPLDDQGYFDVLLSPEKPDDYTGEWWQLDPGANALVLRQVAYDWAEQDPVISIERVDLPVAKPRPDAQALITRMRGLAPRVRHGATLLLPQYQVRRDAAEVNTFTEWDVVGGFGGLFGQFYFECVFDLADDEALLIETDVPDEVTYASMILVNEVYETIDWVNNHSSLNGAQWQLDSDGKLRVVVSAQDPGIANWLDTAGYSTGVIQGRWTEASSTPMPTARTVKVSELAALLPTDTPRISAEDRERILRDRRAQFQQRVHW